MVWPQWRAQTITIVHRKLLDLIREIDGRLYSLVAKVMTSYQKAEILELGVPDQNRLFRLGSSYTRHLFVRF